MQSELDDALTHSTLDERTSPEPLPSQPYPPHAVPYLNDQYTYGDRQNELELIENLLSARLASIRAELSMVREINTTRRYPNIVFKEDTQPKVG